MASFDFLQAANSTADASSYTFTSQNLGAAEATRCIIVTVTSRRTGAPVLNSVTVAGQTATILRQTATALVNNNIAAIALVSLPSGTSGNVVVTFSGTMLRCQISMYRATGINATPIDVDSDNVNGDPTVNLDIPANGYALGVAATDASTTCAWTNLTEDFDTVLEGLLTSTSAHAAFATAQTGLSILANFVAPGTASVGAFVSFDKMLTVDDATNDHTVDNVVLTQKHTLAVDDASHAHTVDSVQLVVEYYLVVQDDLHAHTVDSLVLLIKFFLEVDDASHSHTVDNVTIIQASTLVVQGADHAHTVDNVLITQKHLLSVDSCDHAHTVENVPITQKQIVTASDCLHAHTVDSVVLSVAERRVYRFILSQPTNRFTLE